MLFLEQLEFLKNLKGTKCLQRIAAFILILQMVVLAMLVGVAAIFINIGDTAILSEIFKWDAILILGLLVSTKVTDRFFGAKKDD